MQRPAPGFGVFEPIQALTGWTRATLRGSTAPGAIVPGPPDVPSTTATPSVRRARPHLLGATAIVRHVPASSARESPGGSLSKPGSPRGIASSPDCTGHSTYRSRGCPFSLSCPVLRMAGYGQTGPTYVEPNQKFYKRRIRSSPSIVRSARRRSVSRVLVS